MKRLLSPATLPLVTAYVALPQIGVAHQELKSLVGRTKLLNCFSRLSTKIINTKGDTMQNTPRSQDVLDEMLSRSIEADKRAERMSNSAAHKALKRFNITPYEYKLYMYSLAINRFTLN